MKNWLFIRRLFRISFLLIMFSQAPYGYSLNSEDISNLPKKLTIVHGSGNYPPLEMVADGRLTGLHIEIIRKVAAQLDIKVEFVSLPWVRAIQDFSNGKYDAISYFGFTEQRAKFSYFNKGNILSDTRWVLLALEERKNEFIFDSNLSGLEDVIIGVQRGYSHGKHFDNMKHLTRDIVRNESDLEFMLKKRRHDLVMISYEEFQGFKARGDFKGIVALSPMIDTDPQYIAFSRIKNDHYNLEDTAELFAKELLKFKLSEEYNLLLKAFNSQHYK